ncbi:MAG: hypothetical protein JJ975_01985 [Bacteroidia bacterium]|nr:hypothetical protein [Bacteroidia bacterium]
MKRWGSLVLIWLFTAALTYGQFRAELGIPSIFNSKTNGNSFLTSFGSYIHVGHDFDRWSGNVRFYSAPKVAKGKCRNGLGFGAAYSFQHPQTPNWKYYGGMSYQWLNDRNKEFNTYNRGIHILSVEVKAEYWITSEWYVASMLNQGWSASNYRNVKRNTGIVRYPTYVISLGVGRRFSDKYLKNLPWKSLTKK